jgi:hypothetical protein
VSFKKPVRDRHKPLIPAVVAGLVAPIKRMAERSGLNA